MTTRDRRIGRTLITCYLFVAGLTLAFFAATVLATNPDEPSFAGIWPILVTLPASWPVSTIVGMAMSWVTEALGPDASPVALRAIQIAGFAVITGVSAAINIAVATWVSRTARRRNAGVS